MSQIVTNRLTGESLTVYLELGDELWLCNAAGEIEHVQRDQLPGDRWAFQDTGLAAWGHDCGAMPASTAIQFSNSAESPS
ncbi:hypothetical protein GZ982_30080 (plasmid) [Pseudomonas fluorescens]|nr:hypothetical protein GZ982_30080 [Pseudomonas fluorescens]